MSFRRSRGPRQGKSVQTVPGLLQGATNPPQAPPLHDNARRAGTIGHMDEAPNTTNPAITERIAAYTPTVLSAHLWSDCRDDIRALVVATGPNSVEDAKSLLVALAKFVAWRHRSGLAPGPLRSTLDEASIGAYAANISSKNAKKTAENELGRLRRIHRRINQLPDPAPAAASRPRSAPYTDDEIAQLSASGSVDLRAAVELALDSGTVVPAAYDHPAGYDGSAWARARRAAADLGIQLVSVRLHATWAHQQSQRPVAAAALARSGLTTSELDAIARAATRPTREQLALAR